MNKTLNDIYTEVYRKNYDELETLRKKSKKSTTIYICILAAMILACVVFPMLAWFVIIGGIIALMVMVFGMGGLPGTAEIQEYKAMFKEKVIEPLISNVFEEGSFNPNGGITRLEYEEGRFRDHIDRYKTEDLITAKIKGNDGLNTNVRFAEVHTQKEHTDSDGDRSYQTVFHGLVGIADLNKNINSAIYVKKNWSVSSFNKNKIKMDMSQFEKIFDVEAADKILALRILTSEVMTEIIDLYNKYKISFEVHIINNKIYMRLETGAVFEPNVFQQSMEYKAVEKYYLILQAAMRISKHIYDTVNEIEL